MQEVVAKSYREDYEIAETRGGVFDLTDWGVVEISGPHAADYLNRMSTVAVKKITPAEIHHGAFLTGRGLVVSLGFLQQCDREQFHFIASAGQAPRAAEHLEQFHFQENLTVADVSREWAVFGWWKAPAAILPEGVKNPGPLQVVTSAWQGISLSSWRDDARASLTWVKMKRTEAPKFLAALAGQGTSLLGRRLFEFFRIGAGVPAVGTEISEREIILEAGFDRAVARNKGCYPGQEVVERIFTYGSVNRKLCSVDIRSHDHWPQLPWDLSVEGKLAGYLASLAQDPRDERRAVGLAYINKSAWEWRESFTTLPGLEVRLRC